MDQIGSATCFSKLKNIFFGQCPAACGSLVPWPGIKHTSLALKTWSLNHWSTGEVLKQTFISKQCSYSFIYHLWPLSCHHAELSGCKRFNSLQIAAKLGLSGKFWGPLYYGLEFKKEWSRKALCPRHQWVLLCLWSVEWAIQSLTCWVLVHKMKGDISWGQASVLLWEVYPEGTLGHPPPNSAAARPPPHTSPAEEPGSGWWRGWTWSEPWPDHSKRAQWRTTADSNSWSIYIKCSMFIIL